MNRLKIDDPDETLPKCHACRYPVPDTELHTIPAQDFGTDAMRQEWRFCLLCFSTYAGNAAIHGISAYPDGKLMMQMNFCTNAILDQIGAFKGTN